MPSETEVTGSTALPLVLLSATLYSLYRWPYLRSVCWQVFKLCLAMLCLAICATPHVVGLCVVCVFVPSGASIIYPRPEHINIPTNHDPRIARTHSDPDPGRSVCTSPAHPKVRSRPPLVAGREEATAERRSDEPVGATLGPPPRRPVAMPRPTVG